MKYKKIKESFFETAMDLILLLNFDKKNNKNYLKNLKNIDLNLN